MYMDEVCYKLLCIDKVLEANGMYNMYRVVFMYG